MESTYGSDYRHEDHLPARSHLQAGSSDAASELCARCLGTGTGSGSGGSGSGGSVEARIGRAAVFQARAGGNLSMIANAERYLVTNSDVTMRRPAAVKAPWQRQETKRFLGSKYVSALGGPGGASGASGANAGWVSASGAGRDAVSRRHAAVWEVVADKQRRRRARDQTEEKGRDGEREARWARDAQAHELRRAADICGKKDKFNTDLLELASLASGVSIEDMLSEVDAVVSEETSDRRSAAILAIAESL